VRAIWLTQACSSRPSSAARWAIHRRGTPAATALAHNLAVWTQDDDFEVLAELAPELRVYRG